MSKLVVSNLYGHLDYNNVISVDRSSVINLSGSIIGSKSIIVQGQSAWSAAITGNGTTITDLNLSYTPKFATSTLVMRWMINGEVSYNTVWLLHQDGALITTAGYQGYNNASGNVRWSGMMSSPYDADDSSTPANWCLQYYIPASSTTTRTYAPAIRASGATAYTLYLNRTIGSTGADAYETMNCAGTIWEIAA